MLTSFLHQDYDITSIEPGGFTGFTDELRNKILDQHKLNVHTTTLENFTTDSKFDFIFSMNVLEHTDDIKQHIISCMNLLKDEHSLLFIQCPNYTFPFEPHFYKWFIPFFPNFTFTTLRRKKLIKELGKDSYKNILNNLNFDCTFFKIKKLIKRPTIPSYAKANGHMYYILVKNNKRDKLIKYLQQKKISTVFHYIPLHSSPFGKLKTTTKSTMHNTNRISNTLLRLPLHFKLNKKSIKRCANELSNFFGN